MTTKNLRTAVTGFPRIGEKRELKKVLEEYWSGKTDTIEVASVAAELRKKHWLYQKQAGIDLITVNDFSLYDRMLDTAVMLGAIPQRFRGIKNDEQRYFAMARGNAELSAMEMTKWFATNYHYIVPELSADDTFQLHPDKIVSEYREAGQLGFTRKITIIGPITFLSLARRVDGGSDTLELLPRIVPLYKELLSLLGTLGDEVYIQIEEPFMVKGSDEALLALFHTTYQQLTTINPHNKIIITTYYDHAIEMVRALQDVDLWGIGLDFVHGLANRNVVKELNGKKLIAGVVNGRNIWKNDLKQTLELLEDMALLIPKEDIIISTSCSLLHVPYSLDEEDSLDQEIKSWCAFAKEKLDELVTLADLFFTGSANRNEAQRKLYENSELLEYRRVSAKTFNKHVA